MAIEYEATFWPVDKDEVRDRLKQAGAKLLRPEFLQRRYNFALPGVGKVTDTWLRVRDEGDQITMSLKGVYGERIEDQKEICLKVDNFEEAKNFLEGLNCQIKSYQETKREIWQLDGVEIVIDEWPFLEPLVEIEGPGEAAVKAAAVKAGFDYTTAQFCSVAKLYKDKYNLEWDQISNQTPKIVFEMANPFVK
ncbi:MAG: CYTH domain-containing protein [Patescibacteria group bacterium]|jgi:adenylate cyclase class 2